MKKIRTPFSRWQSVGLLYVFVLLAQVFVPFLLNHASAASLTNTMVRFDRMNTSQPTTGTVCAAASSAGAGTEASVKVTFPTGYTVSTTTSNWAVDVATTTGWPTGATAWPGIGTATAASGQDVTFPSSNIADTTVHCFNWTNTAALTTKSSATADNTGVVTTQATGPTTIDTGNYATATVASTCGSGSQGCDQINVSASVNSTFSFSLGSNAAALGTLTTGGISSATAINASVTTNSALGWQIWARDASATPGLRSTAAGHTIAYSPAAGSSASALSAGTEGFNMGVGTTTGTCNGAETYDAAFDNTAATSGKGGGLDTTLRTVVSGGGSANGCAAPLTVNAAISGTTPAANDYAATLTIVAAGIF